MTKKEIQELYDNATLNKAHVILKFYENRDAKEDRRFNKLISRTLKKISVISSEWMTLAKDSDLEYPRAGEFWRVSIQEETHPGRNSGVFLVNPINKVDMTDIVKLQPGMYEHKVVNGVTIVMSVLESEDTNNWLIPLEIRKQFADCYSVVCYS